MFALLVPTGDEDEREQWIEDLNDDGSAEQWALNQALEHIERIKQDKERAATQAG